MGGKPGQSRGCGTCKKRKKGCDQVRPSCGQCIKSNLICTGYDKEPLPASRHNSGDDYSNASTPRHHSPVKPAAAKLVLMPKLPHSCHVSATRSGLYGSFMQHWIPPTAAGTQVDRFMRGGWVLEMPRMAAEDAVIACAFDALSLIRVGNVAHDARVIARSEVEYGKALRIVRARVLAVTATDAQHQHQHQHQRGGGNPMIKLEGQVAQRRVSSQLETLLCAVLLLCQYEIVSASRGNAIGWMTHTEAALALHRQCMRQGPSENPTLLRKLRCALRIDGIIRAISNRDPSLLIPQPPVVDYGDKLDVLFRIMEEIPALYQRREALAKFPSEEILAEARSIADMTADIFAKFDAWRTLQETSVIDSGYWYETKPALYTPPNEPVPQRECIWFSDLQTATAYTVLWSGILQLCVVHITTTRQLAAMRPSPSPASSPSSPNCPSSSPSSARSSTPPDEPHHIFSHTNLASVIAEANTAAANVVLALPYLCQPCVGSLTSRIIGFPLASATSWRARSAQGDDEGRVAEALRLLRERDGVPLDTFLEGIHKSLNLRSPIAQSAHGGRSTSV